jgi:tRNA A-37 threonylcarbamoyl transferase component Bud32
VGGGVSSTFRACTDVASAGGAPQVSGGGCPSRIEQVRIVRAHRGEDAARWGAALADASWIESSLLLKQDGACWVRRAQVMGREVVMKCRGIDGVWARVKCALGRGKGDRHWRGTALLSGKGVKTARVFALARARVDGRDCELLAMEWLEGVTLLRMMADVQAGKGPGVRAEHAIARAVGEQLARMQEVFNRDHKPSNLIVMDGAGGSPRIAIIDCEGVRRSAIPGAARMFASLVIEPTGCGVRPRRALMMRAVRAYLSLTTALDTPDSPRPRSRTLAALPAGQYRQLRRMLWGDAARVVAHHGDPTPRVNPLA